MNNKSTSIWKRLYQYRIHHILLWIGYYVFWVISYQSMYSDLNMLLFVTLQYLIFHAIAFYIAAYFLIPTFFLKRKYSAFFGLLLFTITLISIVLAICLFITFNGIEETQDIGKIGYFWMAMVSTTTMTGILCSAKILVDNVRSDRQAKVLEQQRLESELQYLKAQVNPHFLFNAINSVYVLIRKDPEKAAETLIKLSDLLRFQLYETSDNLITIEKELEYIKNYVELEKLRRGEKVKFQLNEGENLQGFKIAPFLLMPLLENTFKHVSHQQDNRIEVTLTRDKNIFKASFYNTKDAEPSAEVGGIGLKNLNRRLALLYSKTHTIIVNEDKESYRVTLTVPIA